MLDYQIIRHAMDVKLDEIAQDREGSRLQFDDQEKAVRWILDGLTACDKQTWYAVSERLGKYLTDQERGGLLCCLLTSLPSAMAARIVREYFEFQVHGIVASDHKDDAERWAMIASKTEVDSVVAAGIRKMPEDKQKRLVQWIEKGAP